MMEDASEHTSERESCIGSSRSEPSCWSIPLIANKESRAETVVLLLLFLVNLALQLPSALSCTGSWGPPPAKQRRTSTASGRCRSSSSGGGLIAHDARFYKRATQRSLSLGEGDAGLESGTAQQERYELLAAYLGAVGEPRTNFGPWMATRKPLPSCSRWSRSCGRHTGRRGRGRGRGRRSWWWVLMAATTMARASCFGISHARSRTHAAALAARSFIAAVLLWYGCRWLINTIVVHHFPNAVPSKT